MGAAMERPGFRRHRWWPQAKKVSQVFVLLAMVSIAGATAPVVPIISNYAGTGFDRALDPFGDGGPATAAKLANPKDVAVDAAGNLYVAASNIVRKVTPQGIISSYAGTGNSLYAGDGSLATQTGLRISGIAVDSAGNLYISDETTHRIHKVSTNGIITTIAGIGYSLGYSGDGGDAKQALLNTPTWLATDPNGNLLVTDYGNRRIRKITPQGIITTIAGTGSVAYSGNGGPATLAGLSMPGAIAVDRFGNLYFTDSGTIRKIDAAGIISTYAGTGQFEYDPVQSMVRFNHLSGLAVDATGNLYVVEPEHLVRMISSAGWMRTVAGVHGRSGGGEAGNSGDGGPANQATLYNPVDIAIDAQGNQYVSDKLNHRVRKITPQSPLLAPSALSVLRSPEVIPLPGPPSDIVIGDLNGDRRPDIITTTSADLYTEDPVNEYKLRIQLRNPDGSFAAPITRDYPRGVGGKGGGLALADLDQDGMDDVVLGHASGTSWIKGGPGADLTLRNFPQDGALPADEAITVGDMDRDGRTDVISVQSNVVDGNSSPILTIAYGNGTGGASRRFTLPVEPLRTVPTRNTAVTDVNGDGWLDVVDSGFSLRSMLNDGQGELLSPQMMMDQRMNGLSVGDLDGDLRPDVIANERWSNYLQIFRQVPGGLETTPVSRLSYYDPAHSLIVDINGDGSKDVVMSYGRAIGLMMDGRAGLETDVKFPLPESNEGRAGPLAVMDVDADGCLDILTPTWKVGLVVYKGRNCFVRANGSQPLLPRTLAPLATTESVRPLQPSQADESRHQDAEPTRGLVSRWRYLVRELNITLRVLNWARDRYASFTQQESVSVGRPATPLPVAAALALSPPSGIPSRSPGSNGTRGLPLLVGNDRRCLRAP